MLTRRDVSGRLLGSFALSLVPGKLAAQQTEVAIGLSSSSLGPAAPRIAKELGLFEKHGLSARLVVLDSANTAMTALLSKSIHANTAGMGEIVPARARGQDVVIVANMYAGLSTTMVIAKSVADKLGIAPNAPIEQRLKACDGLLVAAPSATSASTVAFKGATMRFGANLRFTYLAQPSMPAAFESGAIQGYLASAPFWAPPVLSGSGVVWISGPKGELPKENAPISSAQLQVLREYAVANPAIVKSLAVVFADLAKAINERPADVKAAMAKLFPDLTPTTLDLMFASEAPAWAGKPVTAADMVHEISFIKTAGAAIPDIDKLDPAAFVWNP